MKGGISNMMPLGYRALIILASGFVFYILTGNADLAFGLTILISYLEFRKQGTPGRY